MKKRKRNTLNDISFDIDQYIAIHIHKLIDMIIEYGKLYVSIEYILEYDACRKFGDLAWKNSKCDMLGTRILTRIVIKSGLSRKLKWGDVVNVGNQYERNYGRNFWIDDQLIPFCTEYDDYGSIYPWMACNKVGNIDCWNDSASGHGTNMYFDFNGYTMSNVAIMEKYCNYYKKNENVYITTVCDKTGEEWYIESRNKDAVINLFKSFEKIDVDINASGEDSGEDSDEQNEEDIDPLSYK